MSERRFNEAEVEAIFARAAETQQTGARHLTSGEGMTLAQLQEIGREVGIAAELVADAANAIERVGQPTGRRFLGLPIGVGRTIELGRRLTEEEWERLVVDLRETFEARGNVRSDGSLRQWTNGNLQALLEPTATGHRVRMRTMKANSLGWMAGGLGAVVISGLTTVAGMLAVNPINLASQAMIVAMGVGMFAIGALQVPRWARTRQRQMEEIAERLAGEAALPPGPDTSR